MKKVTVFIDGGFLRSYAKKAGQTFDPALVVRAARACVAPNEDLFRVLYYDCAPFVGTLTLPISGGSKVFTGSVNFLKSLAEEEFFAVRLGVLKFRGWQRTKSSLKAAMTAANAGIIAPPITDLDFQPKFEQKGVDLRIGLDMTAKSNAGVDDLMVLMTGDTDLIPALKIVRSRGIQVAGVGLPNYNILPELKQHLDVYRKVLTW